MKNHMQEKHNEASVKYVQDIIDRSWEILHQMEEEGKKLLWLWKRKK
jgi:hypothetical protein